MNKRLVLSAISSLGELQDRVTHSEWIDSQKFSSATRRCEWLSWRAALRDSLRGESFMGVGADFEIMYHPSGAPYIPNTPIYISVSHTRSHVAILLCDVPCAIDMELQNRRFEAVESRYITPSEMVVVGENICDGRPLLWCLKEAAYKLYPSESLDFLSDISLQSIDYQSSEMTLLIRDTPYVAQFELHDEFCIVWM